MVTKNNVKALQWLLNGANRYHKNWNAGSLDGVLGSQTKKAIHKCTYDIGYHYPLETVKTSKEFHTLRGYLIPASFGKGYIPRGPFMLRRAKNRAEHPQVNRVQHLLDVAARELGVHEEPWHSNSGPRVRVYQSHTFLGGTGWPWCAAYVNFCMDEAGVGLPYKTAGAYDMLRWGRMVGWAVSEPEPGDMAIWNVGSGHINIVTSNLGSTINCIDGNHLDQVMRTQRPRWEAAGFVRNPKLHAKSAKTNIVLPPHTIEATGEDGDSVVLNTGAVEVGKLILQHMRE